MSGLQDLCRTLEAVNRDAENLAAELGLRAQHLAQVAVQAATLGVGSYRTEGTQTAQALQAASRSSQQAAQLLHQVAVEGRGFVTRHAGVHAGQAAGNTLGSPNGEQQGGWGTKATGGDGVHTRPGLPAGCVMVPVSLIDQAENPINGPQDFRKGYSIEDLDHAFALLESRILPDLANGADPATFAAQDQADGTYGVRSLSDTYSGFLDRWSGNVIRLELKPNGSYSIVNGRHRIYVASQSGRQYVPAFISGHRP